MEAEKTATQKDDSSLLDGIGRDKRGNVYEILVRREPLFPDGPKCKFLLRQIVLYRIKDTDVWIYTKYGCTGNSKKHLIELVNRSEELKPKVFERNLYGYHLGQPYETDDQGAIVGDWPTIGTMSLETDMVKVITGEDIENYKLWTMPIPLGGIVDMEKGKVI